MICNNFYFLHMQIQFKTDFRLNNLVSQIMWFDEKNLQNN